MPLASSNPLVTTEGRVLTLHKLQIRKNVVCFDTNILASLMFWKEQKCDIIDTRGFDFQKYKLASHSFDTVIITDQPKGSSELKFMMYFGLDSQKQINVVSTQQILDVIGEIGGFGDLVFILIGFIGTYFSRHADSLDFIQSYYTQMTRTTEKGHEIKPIRFSQFHVLYQPFLPLLYFVCKRSKSFRRSRLKRNDQLLQKGIEKTTKYLDISLLLNRINTSYTILNQPLKTDHRVQKLSRFRKDQTLDLEESSSESDQLKKDAHLQEHLFHLESNFSKMVKACTILGSSLDSPHKDSLLKKLELIHQTGTSSFTEENEEVEFTRFAQHMGNIEQEHLQEYQAAEYMLNESAQKLKQPQSTRRGSRRRKSKSRKPSDSLGQIIS